MKTYYGIAIVAFVSLSMGILIGFNCAPKQAPVTVEYQMDTRIAIVEEQNRRLGTSLGELQQRVQKLEGFICSKYYLQCFAQQPE